MGLKEKRRRPLVHPSVRPSPHSARGSPAHQRGGCCKCGVGGSPALGAAAPQQGLAVLPGVARTSGAGLGQGPAGTEVGPHTDVATQRPLLATAVTALVPAARGGPRGHPAPDHPLPSSAQSKATTGEVTREGPRERLDGTTWAVLPSWRVTHSV